MALCTLVLGLSLTACGGGGSTTAETETPAKAAPSFQPTSSEPPSEQTIALQKEGARLNSDELAQIAKTGVLPKAFEGQLLSGAEQAGGQKLATTLAAVYRFFNTQTGAHFYTTSTAERDNVLATMPFMTLDGTAFHAASVFVPGLSPVYRFYNTQTGVHFYTISQAERVSVLANLPQFTYEGVAYYASTMGGTGYTPLYRFFHAAKGFHFYSASAAERDTIIATLPQYSYEGIGYYALASDWLTPAVPHSSVASSQCYGAGSDGFLPCANPATVALNPQQDGHRVTINAMSYSLVAGQSASECVRDNITGLVWEMKTASGLRSGTATYSNSGGGAATDSSGYVTAINGLKLCGFSDWRMPSVHELIGIMDFGVGGSGVKIRASNFPFTNAGFYWAADTSIPGGGDGSQAWIVGFGSNTATTSWMGKVNATGVRLVRGAPWTGQRYVIGSVSYPGDGANNVVLDRKTGLTWRRCVEGSTWAGSTCSSAPSGFSQEAALAHTLGALAAWRVPNVKELGSLVDYSGSPSKAYDPYIFPGAAVSGVWASTPYVNSSSTATAVIFSTGQVATASRSSQFQLRLISNIPQF
ncbi:hypothetical protein B0E41_00695 [Hydrogenophaga sp. A37]|nr:hypothetical protein B0E41_00695 [Hydrogenophaga sp. A37]